MICFYFAKKTNVFIALRNISRARVIVWLMVCCDFLIRYSSIWFYTVYKRLGLIYIYDITFDLLFVSLCVCVEQTTFFLFSIYCLEYCSYYPCLIIKMWKWISLLWFHVLLYWIRHHETLHKCSPGYRGGHTYYAEGIGRKG